MHIGLQNYWIKQLIKRVPNSNSTQNFGSIWSLGFLPNASLIKRLVFGLAFFLSLFLSISGGRLHIDLKNYMGKTSAEFEFYAKFWVDMSNFTGGNFF